MRNMILFGFGKNAKAVARYLDKKEFNIVVFSEEEAHEAKEEGYLNVEFLGYEILDEDLIKVGINEAKIAICMLEDEAKNMFLALSIHHLNSEIQIIAKSGSLEYSHKYKLAGVNHIINSNDIIKNRIMAILKKPITLEVVHNIVFEDNNLSFAQIEILGKSFLDGKFLKEVDISNEYNLVLIGIIDKEENEKLQLIAEKEHKLDGEDILVVIGDKFEIERLKDDMKESVKWHLQ